MLVDDDYALRIVQLLMTGDEVQRLRKQLGKTQVELGELLGVSGNSIARWERGEMGVRESAARLLRLLAQQRPKRRGKRR